MPADGAELLKGVRRKLRTAGIAANGAGGLVVFLFLAFVLPPPTDVKHAWWLVGLNGGLLALSMVVALPLASTVLGRVWLEGLGWAVSGREPTEREREVTLRFPLTQQKAIAMLWAIASAGFGLINVFFSPELAANVAITILLGGLVTVSLGYLQTERLMRPIAAMALASGVPPQPQLPGVATRALLSWTLGTGVVVAGLVLVAIGALTHATFSVAQLAVVVIVLGLVGLIVGLASQIGLARSLADRIEDLRRAVSRVEAGELGDGVTVDDGSEIGLLQAGFNRMLAGLRERERIRDLFGRQVGEDVVRHALERGVELGGEAREAAVLFVDLEGSTRLAQDRDPAEVVALLNAFFAVVVDVVAGHGGWVNKFEGDAALCAFGVPLPDDACVASALAAGRDLAARLRREVPQVRAGIGISAGRVVAGNVGAAQRFEYTVIGDPVNEAARLSDLAKREPGGVLASAATLERVGDEERALWSPGREVELRGRSGVTRVAAPASLPASAPASVPPSVPASVPPSVPASVAPSVRASVPAEAAVPASAGDGVPPLTPAPGA